LIVKWNRDGVMHSESGDNNDDDGDDDELVRESPDDSGEVLYEVHSRDEVRHGGKSSC